MRFMTPFHNNPGETISDLTEKCTSTAAVIHSTPKLVCSMSSASYTVISDNDNNNNNNKAVSRSFKDRLHNPS